MKAVSPPTPLEDDEEELFVVLALGGCTGLPVASSPLPRPNPLIAMKFFLSEMGGWGCLFPIRHLGITLEQKLEISGV